MRTPGPTARPAHAGFEFGNGFADADAARLGEFPGRDPADPFIPREYRNVIPNRRRFRFGVDRFFKVGREGVHRFNITTHYLALL